MFCLELLARLGGLRLPAKGAEPELEQAELVFVAPPAPPSRRQSCFCSSHSLRGWSRSTSGEFGRAPTGVATGAGAGACQIKEALGKMMEQANSMELAPIHKPLRFLHR